jgi:hypothetical protein
MVAMSTELHSCEVVEAYSELIICCVENVKILIFPAGINTFGIIKIFG